jgi:hypothetical protein
MVVPCLSFESLLHFKSLNLLNLPRINSLLTKEYHKIQIVATHHGRISPIQLLPSRNSLPNSGRLPTKRSHMPSSHLVILHLPCQEPYLHLAANISTASPHHMSQSPSKIQTSTCFAATPKYLPKQITKHSGPTVENATSYPTTSIASKESEMASVS